ncbi:hypothetical protein ACROYT_G002398 [Oculina patagonica]
MGILARLRLAKIRTMARPNSPDMPPKRTKKFVMVLFAVMLLPNYTLPKPFTSQELEQKDQNFAEKELEASHAVNRTSAIRVKRSKECDDLTNPSDYLKCWCPRYTGPESSSEGCEKARYNCRGFAEAVCAGYSFACHSNIGQYGFPSCFENHVWVSINTRQGTKRVKWTKSCSCNEQ